MRWYVVLFCALILACSHDLEAKKGKRRKVVRDPDSCSSVLKGSRKFLALQNAKIDELCIRRVADDHDLAELIQSGELVPIITGEMIAIDKRLDPKWRYVHPYVNQFLTDLISSDLYAAYFKKFHKPIWITSAVRTVEYQKRLQKINRNAAAPLGPLASLHTAGVAIDIGKKKLGVSGAHFMRRYLCSLKKTRFIEVVEERYQAVFHVVVFPESLGK